MMAEPDVASPASPNELHPTLSGSRKTESLGRHAAHIAFILAAIVALFWQVFFLGRTLIDVNTLNNQLPWGYIAGQSDYPYNRRDLTDTYVTREYFVASAYRDGEFPLWNPYTMAGHPIYADGVTRTLSPFLLMYKFFDVPLGYSLARLFELMLAAIAMYLFLIAIGASANGGLLGSLVFAFSAHSMLHLTGLGWWGGLMWFPLILLFADRAIRRRSYIQAILAGVFLAMQFFCGYLPNQIYYVGAVILYYSFFAYNTRNSGGAPASRRLLVLMTVTLGVGLALSATQWVPSLELLSYSNRKIVGAELGYVYLPPWYAGTLLFPNLFGAAYDAKALTLFTALGVSHDHILYLGIAALLPIGVCLYWLRDTTEKRRSHSLFQLTKPALLVRDHIRFFVGLAALSLVIMMTAPVYVYITRFIPILQVIRVAVRAGVLFLMAASVLAAFGTDLLIDATRESLRRFARLARSFAVGVGVFVLLAIIGSYIFKSFGVAVQTGERGRMAFIRRSALQLSAQFTPPGSSILIPMALLGVVVFLLWLLIENRLPSRVFFVSLVALLLFDLAWNSAQFDHTFDRAGVFPKTRTTDLIHSLPPGRVLVVPSDLDTNRRVSGESGGEKIIAPPNTLLPYQIATVTGKNQQFPKWYREYASLIEPQRNLSHVVFDEYRSPFFDLLNVRYVMTHESAAVPAGYERLGSAEGITLYENKNAMPRAFFAREVIKVANAAASLDAMRDPGFDPRASVVIEDGGGSDASTVNSVSPRPADVSEASIVEDRRNRVVIETIRDQAGVLVLADNYYPGWRAFVDGSPVQVFRANHTMRAVNVPAGRHMLSFAFAPAAFFVSVYVSIAVAVSILAGLILLALKRRWE